MTSLSRYPPKFALGDSTSRIKNTSNKTDEDDETEFSEGVRKTLKTPMVVRTDPAVAKLRAEDVCTSPNFQFLQAMKKKISDRRLAPASPLRTKSKTDLSSSVTSTTTSPPRPFASPSCTVQKAVSGTPGGLPSSLSCGGGGAPESEDEDENDYEFSGGATGRQSHQSVPSRSSSSRVPSARVASGVLRGQVASIYSRLERIERELDEEENEDGALAAAPPSDEMRRYASSLLSPSPRSAPTPANTPAASGSGSTPTPVKLAMDADSVNVASPPSPSELRASSPLGEGVDEILREAFDEEREEGEEEEEGESVAKVLGVMDHDGAAGAAAGSPSSAVKLPVPPSPLLPSPSPSSPSPPSPSPHENRLSLKILALAGAAAAYLAMKAVLAFANK